MSVAKMYVGLDLGNEKNALCVVDAAGGLVGQRLARNDLDTLDGLKAFTKETAPRDVHVAVEDRRNAVVDALVGFGFVVFTINPKQVDRFRDRFTVAGAKDDRRDAFVLATSLRTDPLAFRRVELETATQIELRSLAARINDLDGELRRMSNQLRAQLLRYFPAILTLLGGCDRPWLWELVKLLKSPTLALGVSDSEIGDVLRKCHVRKVKVPDVRAVVQVRHLPTSAGVAEAALSHALQLIDRLHLVDAQRDTVKAARDKLLAGMSGTVDGPSDVDIILSVPGIGAKTATTLIVEAAPVLRSQNYGLLRAIAGVAPVTKRSGKSELVNMRYACNPRLRNALHLAAQRAIQGDERLAALYASQRSSGSNHSRALRTIADRMLKLVTSMLRTRQLYDENRRKVAAPSSTITPFARATAIATRA